MLKNIILIYPSFERGGVKENFLNYIKTFSNKRFNLFLISDHNLSKYILKKKNIKICIIKKNKFNILYKYLTSFYAACELYKLKNLYDKKNLRVISFQSSFFSSIICKLLGYKLIIRVSEDPIGATKYADNFLLSRLILLSKIVTYNLSYKVFANSKIMKNNLKKLVFNKKKITLLYNMNLVKILKNKNKKRENIFLNVGRLCKQKNQIILLSAFKLFLKTNKKFILYFCGDGPDYTKLKLKCRNLNLDRHVKFLGWKHNIDKYLKKSKFFIFPTLYEGLPNSLIKAFNNNLICISSNVSGVRDICGKKFVSINKNTSEEIASKMIFAVKNYDYLYKQFYKNKTNLKKFLLENFDKKLITSIN